MPYTKIQAVNRILRAGGGSPVNSLGSGSDSSNLAEAALDDHIRSIQIQTQMFNTVKSELIPNVDGKIPLDAAMIAVDGRRRDNDDSTATTSSTSNNGINVGAAGGSSTTAEEQMNVTPRGGFLYNLKGNTDIFTKNVLVWITREFDYDACPAHVQEYAIARAAREYQMEHMGDELAEARLASLQEEARQWFNTTETRQADANQFTRMTNTTLLTVGSRHQRRTPNSIIPGANF